MDHWNLAVCNQELRGTIKGSGYLCGCQSCNYSKVIHLLILSFYSLLCDPTSEACFWLKALNAYEFAPHAGHKTKHPNNHIYFENGKTIYQIVQELRNTPESSLFDAIQNVTGSPINQKAFRIWKGSTLLVLCLCPHIHPQHPPKWGREHVNCFLSQ